MRVLVISSNSFSKIHNNGKTLESFLGTFGRDNLAQLFFYHNESPDFEFCENYFQITDIDVLKKTCGLARTCGGKVGKSFAVSPMQDRKTRNILFGSARKRAKNLAVFRDMLWGMRAWNTASLRNWCRDFNPDVIFFMGGGAGFPQSVARYLSGFLNIPLVTYFTDDYLIFPQKRNVLDRIQRWRMGRFYRKTVQRSSRLFAIGEQMSKEYSDFFGKPFYPLMNSVPIFPYTEPEHKDRLVISYFGGLHLNRWQMLVRLARLASETSTIKINVYAVSAPSEEVLSAFTTVGIDFKGSVSGQELRNAIQKSDILLHVESDDSFNRSLTRLSVSTKIPEYLMSGRVILGFGPVEVASMRLLSDNEIGLVISSDCTDAEIDNLIKRISNDPEYREKIGLAGYKYAIKTFDNVQIVERFRKMMETIKK